MGRNLTANEKRTLEDCLRNLRALRGCRADYTPAENEVGAGALRLEGPWGQVDYQVLTRLRLSAAGAEVAINQIRSSPHPEQALLMTDYLPEGLSQKLRQNGVDFVDAAGNASLQQPPLYVEVCGRRRIERRSRQGRAFQTAGLKLIFLLLRQPRAVRWTYRELAQEAGIALGAVGPVLRELEDLGYLVQRDGERDLLAQRDLLMRWELGYSEKLQPALVPQSCRPAGCRLSELPDLVEAQGLIDEVLVGGELGAATLLQQGQAATACLHLSGDILRTMLRLQLVPDPAGPVRVLKRFGHADHWQGWRPHPAQLADPLLLHAEMQLQAAAGNSLHRLLFERYLAPRLAGERPE